MWALSNRAPKTPTIFRITTYCQKELITEIFNADNMINVKGKCVYMRSIIILAIFICLIPVLDANDFDECMKNYCMPGYNECEGKLCPTITSGCAGPCISIYTADPSPCEGGCRNYQENKQLVGPLMPAFSSCLQGCTDSAKPADCGYNCLASLENSIESGLEVVVPPVRPPVPNFGIKGDVLEVVSYARIPNSIVTITNKTSSITVATDPRDGSYFVPLGPGTYGVIASAPGYISSKGMSEDHVVVTRGVNTTYNLRLRELPPTKGDGYNGEDAALIVIRNDQICNSGSYNSCGNEDGCGYSTGVATSYGLCIVNASLSSPEARDTWTPPPDLGSVHCVELTGVASIESLQPNEWNYSVPAGNYTIVEYLFVSEINPGYNKSPCTHRWLKPPRTISIKPGETKRFHNSAYEWGGDSKCVAGDFNCSKCLQIFPEYMAAAMKRKGDELYNQRKYYDAIKAYEEAIKLNPNYANAWNNMGNALNDQGKYEDAIKAYEEAIRLKPNFSEAWYNKGYALYNLGKYDDAIKAFKRSGSVPVLAWPKGTKIAL